MIRRYYYPNIITMSFRMAVDEHEALIARASKEGRSRSRLIRAAVKSYLYKTTEYRSTTEVGQLRDKHRAAAPIEALAVVEHRPVPNFEFLHEHKDTSL
jgi:predicted DNA-binding protein